jgi:hypothetical protein
MEINGTRHVTPDLYSIKEVRVEYDWSKSEPKYVAPYLSVSLEPEGYFRDRFAEGGSSYEKKKHGARSFKISAAEFKRLADAFTKEIELCHRLLLEHGLIPELLQMPRGSLTRTDKA